jgi:hypothetical protein
MAVPPMPAKWTDLISENIVPNNGPFIGTGKPEMSGQFQELGDEEKFISGTAWQKWLVCTAARSHYPPRSRLTNG